MKKSLKLENLGCANCAAKMERVIGKLDGVNSATINYMTSKLIIDIDDVKYSTAITEVDKCIRKIEPDCRLVII